MPALLHRGSACRLLLLAQQASCVLQARVAHVDREAGTVILTLPAGLAGLQEGDAVMLHWPGAAGAE